MPSTFDVQQFAREVEALACGVLAQNSAEVELGAAGLVRDFSEEVARKEVKNEELIDCRPGCADCCIVNVAVLNPEAEAIAGFLVESRTAAELEDLDAALQQLYIDTRWLDDEERIMVRRKCAFLDQQGTCSIYPVRPLLCRAVTSTDAASCREALAMVAFGENRPIRSNLLQRQIFETAFSSFGRALEMHARDHRSHRLTASDRKYLRGKLPDLHDKTAWGKNVH